MKKIIMERLQCKEDKKEARAAAIEKELRNISPELQPLLDKWLKDGHCEDDKLYHGYSLSMLMHEKGLHITGALLTLDWIIKEPDAALKALSEPIL